MRASEPQPFRLPIQPITDETQSDPWLAIHTMQAFRDAELRRDPSHQPRTQT
ncbi:MAG TPA: hypothetical protein VE197_09770 [Mycobacterium sp.]|nr:hypothetical protein [Mycobacterium sp.]